MRHCALTDERTSSRAVDKTCLRPTKRLVAPGCHPMCRVFCRVSPRQMVRASWMLFGLACTQRMFRIAGADVSQNGLHSYHTTFMRVTKEQVESERFFLDGSGAVPSVSGVTTLGGFLVIPCRSLTCPLRCWSGHSEMS